MPNKWDRNKLQDVNDKTWRRPQLEQYVKMNPDHKPKDVLKWLQSQNPNPWPTCDSNNLTKIMGRIRKTASKKKLSVCSQVSCTEYQPLMLEWDWQMPPNCTVHNWRRVQLARYLDEFPDHKPKRVML